jgi:23S rRNA G2069 N7-methylase RlmK/C1962 C5-methylase RlmI
MILRRIISNSQYTVDQYGTFAWVTLYSKHDQTAGIENQLKDAGITCAVKIQKNKTGLPSQPEVWFGDVPEKLTAEEDETKYEIRCLNTFHAGLFLDHQCTREWLKDNSKDLTLLNLFSYTGSLAISAAKGEAIKTTSIDLSNPSTQWAKINARLNNLNENHQFIKGDVFDWTKRFIKRGETFNIVVSDPPSQSRSDELHFTTQKHLDLLHELCMNCLEVGGTLITSVNTESISEKVLIASVHHVAEKLGRTIKSYGALDLPEGFEPDFRSMKGLRVTFGN